MKNVIQMLQVRASMDYVLQVTYAAQVNVSDKIIYIKIEIPLLIAVKGFFMGSRYFHFLENKHAFL
ncbi:hypothetical protein BBI01_08395 [Chryseobacterium artocarpi]|uniref:Uncharacterized protein n=1 Tax=Chryseobacterium artocarpi TaxID=1414727 RepID=A0A1B8ZKM2_9FLAO|nr:hypothetical protein BBI01_08395 [Chryseobacterium artocarpi]